MNTEVLEHLALTQDHATTPAEYINAVWHSAGKVPERGHIVLATTQGHGTHVLGPNMDKEDYECFRAELSFTRWAYIEDLLPNPKTE